MIVKVKCDNNGDWCFLESFKTYSYGGTGNIKATVCVKTDGTLSTPYIFRGDKFVSAKQIEEEMGIGRYLAAKKPFYSKLVDGFIAEVKAGVNFKTGEYLPEKSSYAVYTVDGSISMGISQGELHMVKVTELTPEIDELMNKVCAEVASCLGQRDKFILSRINDNE